MTYVYVKLRLEKLAVYLKYLRKRMDYGMIHFEMKKTFLLVQISLMMYSDIFQMKHDSVIADIDNFGNMKMLSHGATTCVII